MQPTEIFAADPFQPNWWFPQRRQIPEFWVIDKAAWGALRHMRPAFYLASVTLGANKTARTNLSVDPGFAMGMINGNATAADPGDGLGSAQLVIFDPARRFRFARAPVPLTITAGKPGTAGGSFTLREPYHWTGGKSPIKFLIQNRANATNTVTLLLVGRVPQWLPSLP